MTKIDIPERHQEFCRKVARLAREHGLNKFGAAFTPGFKDPDHWQDQIEFSWEQGRHGEDSDKLRIASTKRVWTRLGPAD
jgi:hypothetical protein